MSDQTPDRRTPKPPSPDDLAEVQRLRLEPEPLEPQVGTPPEPEDPSDEQEGGKPTGN